MLVVVVAAAVAVDIANVTDPVHFEVSIDSTSFILLLCQFVHEAITVTLMDFLGSPKCPAFIAVCLFDIVARIAASAAKNNHTQLH